MYIARLSYALISSCAWLISLIHQPLLLSFCLVLTHYLLCLYYTLCSMDVCMYTVLCKGKRTMCNCQTLSSSTMQKETNRGFLEISGRGFITNQPFVLNLIYLFWSLKLILWRPEQIVSDMLIISALNFLLWQFYLLENCKFVI